MMIIKTLTFLLFVLFITTINAYSQDEHSERYSKSITTGVSSAISYPFFLNAMVNGGFRMYNTKANIGYGFNTEIMWRPKLGNFIVSLTDIKAYKRICRDTKTPIDLGLAAGFGVNTSPGGKFLLTSVYFSVPVWKLHFELQPTLVIPSYKSSFININVSYYFNLKKK